MLYIHNVYNIFGTKTFLDRELAKQEIIPLEMQFHRSITGKIDILRGLTRSGPLAP
jgi:hypothetical protein